MRHVDCPFFIRRLFMGLILTQALSWLSACAIFDPDESAAIEPLLMKAGFEVVPANSPEELERLEQLPQNALQPQTRAGKPMFVYADADNCRCAFWGDQSAYARYQKLKDAPVEPAEQKDPASRIDPWSQGPWWVY